MATDNNQTYKTLMTVIVGEHDTGKSTFHWTLKDKPYSANDAIGCDYSFIKFEANGMYPATKLVFGDCNGGCRIQDMFHKMKVHLRILTIDVRSKDAIQITNEWIEKMSKVIVHKPPSTEPEPLLILLGTKTRFVEQRAISTDELQSYAKSVELPYFEVDEANKDQVYDISQQIIAYAYNHDIINMASNNDNHIDVDHENKKGKGKCVIM